MAKGSDNPFPSVLFVEGTAPSSPAATNFRLYYDSADHLLKWKNSAGTVSTIQTGGAAPTLHGVRAYHNTTQTVATGAALLTLLNSERFDTDGYHSTSSATSKLTVPASLGGYYHIGYTFDVASVADAGELLAEIYLNGTTILSVEQRAIAASKTGDFSGSTFYALVPTDFVELRLVSQTTVNTRTINSGASYSPEFWMYLAGV